MRHTRATRAVLAVTAGAALLLTSAAGCEAATDPEVSDQQQGGNDSDDDGDDGDDGDDDSGDDGDD